MTEACEDCATAETNPRSARFSAHCLECSARHLANRHEFFESSKAGAMTPRYRSVLQAVFGGEWKDGHTKVRAWADRMGVS